jgi:hypothetical protein
VLFHQRSNRAQFTAHNSVSLNESESASGYQVRACIAATMCTWHDHHAEFPSAPFDHQMCTHVTARVHASINSAARYRSRSFFGRNALSRISCCAAEPMNEMDVAGCRGDLTTIRVHAGTKDRRSIDASKLNKLCSDEVPVTVERCLCAQRRAMLRQPEHWLLSMPDGDERVGLARCLQGQTARTCWYSAPLHHKRKCWNR